MSKNINAIMIIEMAGRPSEYLKEAMENHLEKLKQDKEVTIHSEKISEPKKIETEKDMHTIFAEINFEVPSFYKMTGIIFDYMPSSFEIISPSEVSFNLQEATSFLNILAGRLHRYDEVAKLANFRVNQLISYVQQMEKELSEKKSVDENKSSNIEEPAKKKPKNKKQA